MGEGLLVEAEATTAGVDMVGAGATKTTKAPSTLLSTTTTIISEEPTRPSSHS